MTTEPSARSKVSQWVHTRLKDQTEVSIPDVTTEALEYFRKDTKFLRQLAEEQLRSMVYRVAIETCSQSRNFVLGDIIVDSDTLKRRARGQSVFTSWLEHAGDHHVRLTDMTREELLTAADARERRGEHEIGLARLWRTMANNLEGGQTVGSKYSADAIQAMYDGLSHS